MRLMISLTKAGWRDQARLWIHVLRPFEKNKLRNSLPCLEPLAAPARRTKATATVDVDSGDVVDG